MDNIVYDVIIGVLVIIAVITVLNFSKSGIETIGKGNVEAEKSTELGYDEFSYENLNNYGERHFAGSEISAFIRYHQNNKDIIQVITKGESQTFYYANSGDDKVKKENIIKLEEELKSTLDTKKSITLYESQFSFKLESKVVTFTLIQDN